MNNTINMCFTGSSATAVKAISETMSQVFMVETLYTELDNGEKLGSFLNGWLVGWLFIVHLCLLETYTH